MSPSDFRSVEAWPPDPNALAHSERLQALIRAEIQAAGGRIPYVRYMELALYAPGLGYYRSGTQKFGQAGDFVTAAEMSPLFARCLSRQCAQVFKVLQGGDLLEVGAGSGALAADMLDALAEKGALPGQYGILELSAELCQRQQALLRQRHPQYFERMVWLDRFPEPGFRGVVIANELLDAMPVHLFTLGQTLEPQELYVVSSVQGWDWSVGPLSHPSLLGRIQNIQEQVGGLPLGYTSEINLAAEAWVRSVGTWLSAGALLCVDYGFPRREYYHPHRRTGTLMCHYRHLAHADPFRHIGLQDITAHIDFTALAEAALESGLNVKGYTTQGLFLTALGLAEDVASVPDAKIHLEWSQQAKRLVLPHEMGELFKVMALTRGMDGPLTGFSLRDLRDRL